MHNLYINQTKATAIPKTIPTQVFSQSSAEYSLWWCSIQEGNRSQAAQ